MGTMTDFPEAYPLIRQNVREIEWYSALSKEEDPDIDPNMAKLINYRWVDFCVRLKNGKVYVFTADTPDFIKDFMEADNMKSWMEPGCIVLREISRECILDAVEKWLAHSNAYGLGHKGVLQVALANE